MTDGPFADTKEVLGGYYVIEAGQPGRGDRAGGAHPGRPVGGAVEVRPVVER